MKCIYEGRFRYYAFNVLGWEIQDKRWVRWFMEEISCLCFTL